MRSLAQRPHVSFTGSDQHSQRAEAAFCLGHYFFYGDPSRDLATLGYADIDTREQLIEEFLANHHNGFSKDIARGRADATAQITRMANWIPAGGRNGEVQTFVAAPPVSWIRENAKRKANARRRIEDAFGGVANSQTSFLTAGELQKAAGCGRDTLYKHSDIWRQNLRTSQRASLHPVLTNITLWRIQFQFLKACRVLLFFLQNHHLVLLLLVMLFFELSLQGRKEAHVQENQVLETAGEFEIVWRSQVAVSTHMVPTELSIQQLKSRLFS